MDTSPWRFFTDQVMGGQSTGRLETLAEDGAGFLRMSGHVSTANRGGFIQMRRELARLPEGDTGVRLIARGVGESFFVHLRSTACRRPWDFYQAPFAVLEDWSEIRLTFGAFRACGGVVGSPVAGQLTSVAVAAYGRDHDARIDLREIGFY